MRVLLTDYQYEKPDIERALFSTANIEFVAAQCANERDLLSMAGDFDALITSYTPVTDAVFEAMPKLRFVSSLGVGLDHIDLKSAKKRGITVENVSDAFVGEVATTALAMSLSLIRHLPFLQQAVARGSWDAKASGVLRRPASLSLGIAGLGNIGRHFAELSQHCFREIWAYDPYVDEQKWPANIRRSTRFDDLLRQSDVLSLHMPLNEQTYHLIDSVALEEMRHGSYLVNVSRGSLVDSNALACALDSGKLAGAALDVLEEEPPQDSHLLRHPRVLVNPHAAFYSAEAEEEARRKAVANVVRWADQILDE